MKKDFNQDDYVRLIETSDPKLDGSKGTLVGKADMFRWIVFMEEQIEGYYKAIVIDESCIEKVIE